MTNAQKWISIFLGLFIILLFFTYLTEPKENDGENFAAETEAVSGKQIYDDLNCASCHGANFEGTEKAPALLNLARNWSKTDLINYLRNPDDFKSSERLARFNGKYGNSFMPNYDGVEIKKLGILAEFLLTK